MPFDPRLLDVLESKRINGWKGLAYRIVIGDTSPLRANSRGARWNPPNIDALYTSLEREAAEREFEYLINTQPVRITKPAILYELDVSISTVIDLGDLSELGPIGFTVTALLSEEWSTAQEVGGAVSWLGDVGLIVPSARSDSHNLVVYVNNQEPHDHIDEHRKLTM